MSHFQLFGKALTWQGVVWLVCLPVLFLPAGTLAWPAGWTFFCIFFGFVGGLSIWLLFRNPDLLHERLQIFSPSQMPGDKVWLTAFYVFSLMWLAIMPADVVRFHWLAMPSWTAFVGMSFLLCSLCGIFLTLRENAYASPVLRLQKERGQVVVDSGVYHYVRHPLYTSACIFYVGVPLLLGSGAGLLLAPVFVGMLMFRSVQEEQMLQRLPGYDSYKGQVTSRFFPHIW